LILLILLLIAMKSRVVINIWLCNTFCIYSVPLEICSHFTFDCFNFIKLQKS